MAELNRLALEVEKCKSDFQYFAETYCCIENRFRNKVFLELFDQQKAILDKLDTIKTSGKSPRLLVYKHRSAGSSALAAALILHRTMFFPESNALMVSYDSLHTKEILFATVDCMYYDLPGWLKPQIVQMQRGYEMKFENNSRVLFASAGRGTPIPDIKFSAAYICEFSCFSANQARQIMDVDLPHAMIEDSTAFAIADMTRFEQNTYAHKLWNHSVEFGDKSYWQAIEITNTHPQKDASTANLPASSNSL